MEPGDSVSIPQNGHEVKQWLDVGRGTKAVAYGLVVNPDF